MNKKGAEMTIGTLVVIVLAIIVLVVLALGFGTGWTNLWGKISGFFSPVNVDTVKQSCAYACTTNARYDYCCTVRDVRFAKDADPEPLTCDATKLNIDCDVNCDIKTQCKDLVCDVSIVDQCVSANTENPAKKFGPDGIPIPKDKVCCDKTTTP